MNAIKGVLALGLIGTVWLVPTASAQTVTIGSVAPANVPANCTECTHYQHSTDPASPSYTVPAGTWTITSWSARGRPTGEGQGARLRVFRPAGENFQIVAESGPFTFPEDSVPVIPTNIPVQPGDRLGLFTGNPPIPSSYESVFEDDVIANAIGFPEVGDTLGPTGDFSRTFFDFTRANVSAVLTRPADPAPVEASCKGTAATVIGTDGADELSGTDGHDVIAGLGGRDEIRGLAGQDLVCGGTGKDTLRGGKGKDKLYGQGGKDKLAGGGGKDRCIGGKKDDTAKQCEVEKAI